MKTIELSGVSRAELGTKDAEKLRREGQVPCVLYGGTENIHFNVDIRDIDKLVFTPNVYLVKLAVGDVTVDALLRDIQFHPVTDRVIHADFLQLSPDKLVDVELPVRLIGNAIGVRNGGKLRLTQRKLKVKGLLADLPEAIEVNIEKLRIGHAVKVGELSFAGLTFLNAENAVVVAVKAARGAVDDEEEEEETAEGTTATADGEAKTEEAATPAEA